MIGFCLVCAILLAIALAFVLPPLLQKRPLAAANSVKDANVAVYRNQIAEMESDLRHGLIAKDRLEQDREELKRRLLEDVSPGGDENTAVMPALVSRRLGLALALVLPPAAVLLYLLIGNPTALSAI